MKIFSKKPEDDRHYLRWYDDENVYDIWYEKPTMIFDYKNMDIPKELINFLDKWTKKIEEYKKTYRELYPVKLAKIDFIYKDYVYRIFPSTVSAIYKSNFMSDEYYDVSWDSLFETYEREIRDDLKKELGVVHSKYIGFLD